MDLEKEIFNLVVAVCGQQDISLSGEKQEQIKEYIHIRITNLLNATKATSILIEAEDIVNGREQATNRKYGKPSVVFDRYAKVFNLIAPDDCFDSEGKLTAVGVVYVIKCIKLGREKVSHKRDNLVDDCGYTEIIAQIREGR